MAKRKKRVKYAQFGIDNKPKFKPVQQDQNYNWLNVNTDTFPGMPGESDPLSQMTVSNAGTPIKKAKTVPIIDPNADYNIKTFAHTGVFEENPYVKDFNVLATGVTGISNVIRNNKLKNEERKTVLHSLEPAYFENMDSQGLNNLPMYTQYGGGIKIKMEGSVDGGSGGVVNDESLYQGIAHPAFYGQAALHEGGSNYQYGGKRYIIQRPYGGGPLTSAGAKEILRDGTVRGHKLTEKQKRYFGWIAGGKKQTGGISESLYKVGEEVDLSNEKIEELKKQGYDFEPVKTTAKKSQKGKNKFSIVK